MKSIQQAVNGLDFQAIANKAANESKKPVFTTEDALLVENVFKELISIFPAWQKAYPSKEMEQTAKKTWTKGFIENDIHSLEQIRWGLRKARSSGIPFIPSVGQFVQWCQPTAEDFGLPDARSAYLECCKNSRFLDGVKWSHVGVYVAGKATGWYEFSNRPERETWPLFKRNYDVVLNRLVNRENLKAEIPLALPKQATTKPTEPTKVKANIAAIKAMLRKAS